MATHEEPRERSGDDPIVPPVETVPSIPPSRVTRVTWILTIVAGVVAGLGSWGATEGVLKGYEASFVPETRPYPSEEDMATILKARIMSGTIAHGVMGGLFGLVLGLAGGMSRRSIAGALLGGGVGLLVGTIVESGVARLVMNSLYTNMDASSSDLLMPLLGHEAVWALAGALGGLAFGLGLGGRTRWLRSAIGGAIGAGLATVVFEILGALAFATSGTALPVSESPVTRALAVGLVAIGTAIGAVLAASDPKPVKPPVV